VCTSESIQLETTCTAILLHQWSHIVGTQSLEHNGKQTNTQKEKGTEITYHIHKTFGPTEIRAQWTQGRKCTCKDVTQHDEEYHYIFLEC
jgi:hypothetical protein